MKMDLNTALAAARIFTGTNLNGTTPDEENTRPITSTAIDTAYIGTNTVITTGDLFGMLMLLDIPTGLVRWAAVARVPLLRPMPNYC